MSFENMNYLLIGGRTGIGRVVAGKLSASGANIVSTARQVTPETDLPAGKQVEYDVTDSDPSTLTETLPEQLHGLVYCPGTINLRPFKALKDTDFRNDLEVNFMGAVRVLRASEKSLKKAEGASVVLFSTVATRVGMNFHASIAAAKSAVEGLAISLAAEWSGLKIRVNVVAPSLTDTPLAARLLSDDKRREASAQRHPLKRVGMPEDIASAALFLLSGESSWITGQILSVDGGMSSLKPL